MTSPSGELVAPHCHVVPDSPRTRWWLGVLCAVILAAGLSAFFLAVLQGYYPVDDTYIALHNASAIWAGSNLHSSGTTSAVYLALLVVILPLLHTDGPAVLGAIAVALYLVGVVRLCRLLRLPRPSIGVLVVAAAVSGLTPLQFMNGLETGLAMATVMWLFVFARSGAPPAALGCLAGTAAFVRPELGVLSLLVVGYRLAGESGPRRRAVLVGATAAAGLWSLWSLWAVGTVIPETMAVKVAWFAEYQAPLQQRIDNLLSGVALFAVQLGPLTLAVVALFRFPLGRVGVLFMTCFYGATVLWLPSAPVQYDGRYQYILVPILVAGLAHGLADRLRWRRACASAVMLAAAVSSLLTLRDHWAYLVRPYDLTRYELTAVAGWSTQHVPPGGSVLVHDAGFLEFQTNLRLVDLVGLTTPGVGGHVASLVAAEGDAGRARAIADTARAEGADFLIVRNSWNEQFGITRALVDDGWTVSREMNWGTYSVYRVHLAPPRSV